uniref:Uncharacterized protein n=1 Tax=Rhizophora mucronata TaxID=61149 RepID=A0A2P2PP78_RHIMU
MYLSLSRMLYTESLSVSGSYPWKTINRNALKEENGIL